MIKAIFLDVDGTLISFKTHRVPASALDALREAHARGVQLFIATGRAAADLADLERRPLYRPLLENHCFQKLVVLTRGETGRACRVSGL